MVRKKGTFWFIGLCEHSGHCIDMSWVSQQMNEKVTIFQVGWILAFLVPYVVSQYSFSYTLVLTEINNSFRKTFYQVRLLITATLTYFQAPRTLTVNLPEHSTSSGAVQCTGLAWEPHSVFTGLRDSLSVTARWPLWISELPWEAVWARPPATLATFHLLATSQLIMSPSQPGVPSLSW